MFSFYSDFDKSCYSNAFHWKLRYACKWIVGVSIVFCIVLYFYAVPP